LEREVCLKPSVYQNDLELLLHVACFKSRGVKPLTNKHFSPVNGLTRLLINHLKQKERERVRKDSIRVEVKRKRAGESERRFISEGEKGASC
jgi:hypothetical protein